MNNVADEAGHTAEETTQETADQAKKPGNAGRKAGDQEIQLDSKRANKGADEDDKDREESPD